MQLPTQEQTNAALRHAATYVAGIGTALGFVAVMLHTQIDTQGATQALQSIVDGVTQVSNGIYQLVLVLGPIVGAISAFFASRSAKPANQAASAAQHIGDPAVQAAILPTIVSQADQNAAVKEAVIRGANSIEGIGRMDSNPAKADATVQRLVADTTVPKLR